MRSVHAYFSYRILSWKARFTNIRKKKFTLKMECKSIQEASNFGKGVFREFPYLKQNILQYRHSLFSLSSSHFICANDFNYYLYADESTFSYLVEAPILNSMCEFPFANDYLQLSTSKCSYMSKIIVSKSELNWLEMILFQRFLL